jgi:hypothetical protein
MISFRTGITLFIIQLIPAVSNAQADSTSTETPVAVSPYSFEIADSLLRTKNYERAVWTYINLYPGNPDSVTARVRTIRPAYWDGDLPSFIQKSFAHMAPMDPAIATFDFNGPVMDSVQLRIRADWSDALIRRIKIDLPSSGQATQH